ncbi:hypothetical protein B0H16DRAFT_586972 [Mycena metata]|uniref:Uncharacterized protein n=1 Tax=Mycena metata TaxID=1033252 RepID=A0AAD7NGH8_9AGAR|nr:hypothetical protein B0H16DRAFT_586972 [Mycena metata]
MTALSLFNDLTDLKNAAKKFPTTELLTELLTLVGHDVVLAKRNNFSVYWTVSQARDVIDHIIDLVDKTAIDPNPSWADLGAQHWQDFDTYTERLLWMEDFLLKFALTAEREALVSNFPNGQGVQEDVEFIKNWKIARTELKQLFLDLSSPGYLSNGATHADIQAIHKRDDIMLLKSVNLRLKGTTVTGQAQANLLELTTKFDTILQSLATASDEVLVYSIQFAMGIDIFVNAQDPKVVARLQDADLWTLAKAGVDLVEQNASVQQLENAWNDFIASLCRNVLLPNGYKDLLRLLSTIKRPYYSQSVGLVRACQKLGVGFNANKSLSIQLLETAVDHARNALTAAATVTYDHRVATFSDTTTATTFTTAENSIKACSVAYNKNNTFEQDMIAARTTDADRLTRLSARFVKGNQNITSGAAVDLTITLPAGGSHEYSVDSNLTLHAVLWKEAALEASPTLIENMRSKGYFHHTGDSTPLDLRASINTLPDSGGKKTVTLAIS